MSEKIIDTREIKITEVKEINKDGKKFKAFKTIAKNGTKMDVKFTQTCLNIPTEPCIVVVDKEMCNVATNRQFPCLWIKDVVEIKPLAVKESNIDDYF